MRSSGKLGNAHGSTTPLQRSTTPTASSRTNSSRTSQNLTQRSFLGPSAKAQETRTKLPPQRQIRLSDMRLTEFFRDNRIERLGLHLRPNCTIPSHNRSLITHICLSEECDLPSRVGCEVCFQQASCHAIHRGMAVPIERFIGLLHDKTTRYTDQIKRMSNQLLQMQNPPFLFAILQEIEEFKEHIVTQIESLKDKIKASAEEMVRDAVLGVAPEVANHMRVLEKCKDVCSKDFFDLGARELELMVQLANDHQHMQIERDVAAMQKTYQTAEDGHIGLTHNVLGELKAQIYPVLEVHQELQLYMVYDPDEIKNDKKTLEKLRDLLTDQIQTR